MSPDISERAFEDAIECGLLRDGPDACPDDAWVAHETPALYGDALPGGYRKRVPEDCDRALCLLPRDVVDFVLATQPKEWQRLAQHHGAAVREQFLKRLAAEIERRGALDVLRNGIKDSGCKFRLAYFRPASGLNEETRRLHAANLFAEVRQLRYSATNERSLDLVLFLNGIPVFTAELKNPLTGQDVQDAIRQYKTDRDPREPLLAHGRCLAHFAVDPDLVYVTTHLAGARTRFLPFNQGKFGGAGNPPVSPTRKGYATAYLWEETWARDSLLDLVRQFIHEVEEEDDKGRKTGRRFLIFPRYQQLDCVRRIVADARTRGAGQRYLVQHSAGSDKSFTITWLAHQLATLHDAADRRIFDSIVVVTDRRILDRQLQATMRQFEQTLGVVENIDTTSRQLTEALESGKTIIVTTLQKFPVIARQIGELPGKRFAVIVDEAHSSQSGESTRSLRAVLSARSLEEAEAEEAEAATPEEEVESAILAEIERRGRLPNLSTFAFTATPKPKTLELFGTRRADGKFEPFHRYTMRQAIEEGFILDVLENYTTYKAYWRLLKTVEDARYDRRKAEYLLESFVELHPHAIAEKVRICVEHFAAKVQGEIGGKAKAMIVTRSRLHAVRYRLAVDRYLAERGYPFKALVAFSGSVPDGGQTYTEAGMNGFPETETARTFERPEHRSVGLRRTGDDARPGQIAVEVAGAAIDLEAPDPGPGRPVPEPERAQTVAIGASAGGVEALHLLIGALPRDLPVPVVVVLHLAPTRPSRLAELLGRHARMEVKQAQHDELLRAGWVYIAPPDEHLLVAAGRVALTHSGVVHFSRPSVDLLLESVAAAYGPRAIAVILTGGGRDGAAGVQAIKQAGGRVIVQDPGTAAHRGMPAAAVGTGRVDEVAPLERIPGVLLALLGVAPPGGGKGPR